MQLESPLVEQFWRSYCDAVQFHRMPFDLEKRRNVEALIAQGVDLEDFKLTLRYLNAMIAVQQRNPGCMRWSNLMAFPEHFMEELCLAMGWKRNSRPVRSAKERVIAQARPTVSPINQPQHNNCRPVADLISDLRRAAGMQ